MTNEHVFRRTCRFTRRKKASALHIEAWMSLLDCTGGGHLHAVIGSTCHCCRRWEARTLPVFSFSYLHVLDSRVCFDSQWDGISWLAHCRWIVFLCAFFCMCVFFFRSHIYSELDGECDGRVSGQIALFTSQLIYCACLPGSVWQMLQGSAKSNREPASGIVPQIPGCLPKSVYPGAADHASFLKVTL